ncbi:MAG TPA: hypothetical protein VGR22_09625 [Thermomicrobiales bacterium]|nr:hypothetical protein [Thermomicrobiales bacterium]
MVPPPLDWLNVDELHEPVGRMLGAPVDAIVGWSTTQMVGGSGEAIGVWEVSGIAFAEGTPREWMIVLKGWGAGSATISPDAWEWPRREGCVYTSTLLDELPPGLAAPQYYGRTERPDGTEWLWLERVFDTDRDPWPLERFAEVARQLGRFNGHWLATGTLPSDPWLSRDWVMKWAERVAPEIGMLDRADGHPLVDRAFPAEVRRGYRRIWKERARLYSALSGLPKTVCHLDAFRRNVSRRETQTGSEMALLDWSFTGIAAVGEEMTPLIAASLYFGDVPPSQAAALESVVLDAYVAGLDDSGWHGDPELARLGYLIATVLRYGVGCVPQMVRVLSGEAKGVTGPDGKIPPLEQVAGRFGVLDEWLVERSNEVLARLAPSSPGRRIS